VKSPDFRSRGAAVRIAGAIAGLSVVCGLLVGAVALPLVGGAGMAAREAADTFNNLQVPALSELPSRSEILDSHGKLITYYYPNHIYRVPVSYSQISPDMRDAIVSIEDSRFYQHGALDIRGSARALVTDFMGGQVQGGSTLAQQYVKNALVLTAASPAQQRDATAEDAARKIRELRIAVNVEHELTLNQLLAAYLNVAYFENEAYGIQVAAQRYFGTTAAGLTLTESALLDGTAALHHPGRGEGRGEDRPEAALLRGVPAGRLQQRHRQALRLVLRLRARRAAH
jgi:membrane peptidoglycan carboxypeptidase